MKSKSQLEQASSLYVINQEIQMLDIFVNNDTFIDFDLPMLKCTGCMTEAEILGFEMINDRTLRLKVRKFAGTEGSLTINAKAFTESQNDLTVEIKLKNPEIYFDELNVINEECPIVSFRTNVYLNHQPQLSFVFDGVLEGMDVSSFDWTICSGTLKLLGKPKAGMATLNIKGLFEAKREFRVVVLNSNTDLLDTGGEIGTSVGIQAEYLDTADNEEGIVGTLKKMTKNSTMVATAMSALPKIQTVISIVNGTFSVIKTLNDLFNWGLFPNPNEKFNEEFGKINTKLDKLDRKIDEIGDAVKANMLFMIAGFKELDYNIMESLIKKDKESLIYFLKQYNDILTTLQGNVRDDKLKNLLNIESDGAMSEAKSIILSLNYLLSCLDPYDTAGEKQDSLTYKYFLKVKTDTPFYHISAQLLLEYSKKWTAELVKYSIIAGLIYNNNILFHPELAELYKKQMNEIMDKIKKVSYNIGKYFADKGALYFNAYDNLVAYDFKRDDIQSSDVYGTGILLVLNRSGKQFLFDNIGNVAAWCSWNCTFFNKLEIFGKKYDNIATGGSVETEFFSGPNSIFALYGAGMTFNNFMAKFVDGDKAVWLRPKDIIIESRDYKKALVAEADEVSYKTREIVAKDCMGDDPRTYARIFCLNGSYETREFLAPSFVKNLSFVIAATPEAALEKMQSTSSDIVSIIETDAKKIDRNKERLYIGFSRTENRKEAITDLFLYASKEKNAPQTMEKNDVMYQKFNVVLNEKDPLNIDRKLLYYTKNQTAGFPVRAFITTGKSFLHWHEIRSKTGDKFFITPLQGIYIHLYLYCKR